MRLKWNLVSVRLEIVLVSVQDRCTVCAKQVSEIISEAPDGILDDEAQVESSFGLFGDSVSISARQVHGLCQTYHKLRNHFGRTRW